MRLAEIMPDAASIPARNTFGNLRKAKRWTSALLSHISLGERLFQRQSNRRDRVTFEAYVSSFECALNGMTAIRLSARTAWNYGVASCAPSARPDLSST
jgi:hypothetical protein